MLHREGAHHDGVQEAVDRSEEHTSELQSLRHLVCRLLLEKKMESGSSNTSPAVQPDCASAWRAEFSDIMWGALISTFFFNDPATPEIYTLSLHDALPIWLRYRDLGASRTSSNSFTVRPGCGGKLCSAIGIMRATSALACSIVTAGFFCHESGTRITPPAAVPVTLVPKSAPVRILSFTSRRVKRSTTGARNGSSRSKASDGLP